MSAEEMVHRIDEALDQWRSLTPEAKGYVREDYVRRLHTLQVPPDMINRWLATKLPAAVRKAAGPSARTYFPQQAVQP